jgi:hypothetical protein
MKVKVKIVIFKIKFCIYNQILNQWTNDDDGLLQQTV